MGRLKGEGGNESQHSPSPKRQPEYNCAVNKCQNVRVDIPLQNCSMSAWLHNEEQQTEYKAKLHRGKFHGMRGFSFKNGK